MLKKKWLGYKSRKTEKKRSFDSAVDFGKSTKIALVFSLSKTLKDDFVDKIISDLGYAGKEISTLAFCKNKKKEQSKFPLFDLKDVGVWGGYNDDRLDFFMNQKFDLVICLDQKQHFLIDFILSNIKAKCRIGIGNNSFKSHCEMILQFNKKPLESKEVIRYLKMIQSNEH